MDRKKTLDILIVEDNDDDFNSIEKALRPAGHGLRRLCNGREALEFLLEESNVPDVILMDYKLPVMDGLQVMSETRAKKKNLAYVLLTSDPNIDTAIAAMRAGAFDFLSKVKGYAELPDIVQRVHELNQAKIEKKRFEEDLKKSEERFRGIAERSQDIIYETDAKGLVTYISPAVRRMLGYEPSEIIGASFADFVPEKTGIIAMGVQEAVMKGQSIKAMLFEVPKKTGEIVSIEINCAPIVRYGSIVGTQGIVRDISERKRSEESIRRAYKEITEIFNITTDGIRVVDTNFRILRVNEAYARLAEAKVRDLVGQKCSDEHKSSDCQTESCPLIQILKGKEYIEKDIVKIGKEGKSTPCIMSSVAFRGGKGEVVGMVQNFKDITERKQMEESVRESEARYRTLFEAAAEGILVTDVKTGMFKYANPAICRMLGYPENDLLRMEMNDIYPKEALERLVCELKYEKVLVPDVACVRADGNIVHMDINSACVPLDGTECHVGFFTDITERKKAQEKLMEAVTRDTLTGLYNRYFLENSLRGIVNETMAAGQDIGLYMIDLNKFKYLNDNFGHQKGDKVLTDFANLLRASIKSTDYAVRFGGDEFVVVLTQPSHEVDALMRKRLEEKVALYNRHNNRDIGYDVSFSAGFARMSQIADTSFDNLIKVADTNMYDDKHGGR